MGDRTTVTLCVPTVYSELAIKIIDRGESWENTEEQGFSYLIYEDVNYGELHNLHLLLEAGIPYDSSWASGDDYAEGCEHGRFTPDGDMYIKTIYAADERVHIDSLNHWASLGHEYVLEQIELVKERIRTPSWDNQVEYGKLYKVKQLLGA